MSKTYHIKTCNSRRGPGYPCDCPRPTVPATPSPERKRLDLELRRAGLDHNLIRRDVTEHLVAAGYVHRDEVLATVNAIEVNAEWSFKERMGGQAIKHHIITALRQKGTTDE